MAYKKTIRTAFILMLWFSNANAVDSEEFSQLVSTGGYALMLRHAHAPGSGDPSNFNPGDCATQRNLDRQGRTQAHRIGRWFKDRGIKSARVYTSQWCRCMETAELMELGEVIELRALNSFFDRPQDRESNLEALQAFISEQPINGELIVMVTHYVTICGFTGASTNSGEGVLLRLTGGGEFAVVGKVEFR